jgi:methionyl-tRNA formyltransferase
MKIVFFGTPPFAAEVLDHLMAHGVNVVAVVTKPDKPKGRSGDPVPTAVKSLVLQKYPHLPLFQPALISAPGESDILLPFHADLFVVVAYGEIIKQHLLDMPPLGCINVHASLLPKYRGAAPIQRAIINGESESGVTIMYMVKKMDAGDMIQSLTVPIEADITFGDYEKLLCRAGCEALLDVVTAFSREELPRVPQNHELATLAPKIELEDCEIDWANSAQAIHDLVRGVNPYPGAWCTVLVKGEKKRLKIWQTEVINEKHGRPGAFSQHADGRLVVACGESSVIVLELQLEGKKAMHSQDLLRGLPLSAFCVPGQA